MQEKTEVDTANSSAPWWRLSYPAAVFVGATMWAYLLFFATAVLLIESAFRIDRGLTFSRRRHVPSDAGAAAKRVVALSVAAFIAALVVAFVGLSGWRDPGDGLSARTVGSCLILLVARAALESVASRISRSHGIAPPFVSDVREGLEDAAAGLGGQRNSRPRFGGSGRGEAVRVASLTSLVIVGALIAAISGNTITPQNGIATAIRLFRGEEELDGDGRSPKRSRPEDVETSDESSTDRSPNPTQPSVSPSASASPVTAAEHCGYVPEREFESLPPAHVAAAMIEAYFAEGAQEIGCPDDGVKEDGAVYFARLSRGESEPSWVVGDDSGRAAVVFDDLVPLAKRLRRNHVFAGVFPRQSTGGGDYQIFEKTDRSCILAIRNLYSQGYVVLPTPVTHTVMQLSILRGAFPYVEDLDASSGLRGRWRFRVSWTTSRDGRSVSEAVEMTKRTAPNLLRGAASALVDKRECPDSAAFDLLAAEAREVGGAEAAAAIGKRRRVSAL